jgi:hypothetical protein
MAAGEATCTTQTESRNDRAETKQVRQDVEELAFGETGFALDADAAPITTLREPPNPTRTGFEGIAFL